MEEALPRKEETMTLTASEAKQFADVCNSNPLMVKIQDQIIEAAARGEYRLKMDIPCTYTNDHTVADGLRAMGYMVDVVYYDIPEGYMRDYATWNINWERG